MLTRPLRSNSDIFEFENIWMAEHIEYGTVQEENRPDQERSVPSLEGNIPGLEEEDTNHK